jgi:hypothetical protein
MLLSEARTKVLKLLDDEDGARYDAAADSSELDIALKSAMGEAWTQAIANGADLFVQEASFSSDSTGLVDLSASKVRRIDNVAQIISTTRLTVPCVNLSDIVNTMAQRGHAQDRAHPRCHVPHRSPKRVRLGLVDAR